jgi:hypothetical protein
MARKTHSGDDPVGETLGIPLLDQPQPRAGGGMNQRFPSGPAVIPAGWEAAVAVGNLEIW